MDRQAFSNVNNFVMAENVSTLAVATIKEHSLQLPGVEIVETSARSYDQSDIIPAVLGRVGKITAEKWKVTDSNGQVTYPLREKGYNMMFWAFLVWNPFMRTSCAARTAWRPSPAIRTA